MNLDARFVNVGMAPKVPSTVDAIARGHGCVRTPRCGRASGNTYTLPWLRVNAIYVGDSNYDDTLHVLQTSEAQLH